MNYCNYDIPLEIRTYEERSEWALQVIQCSFCKLHTSVRKFLPKNSLMWTVTEKSRGQSLFYSLHSTLYLSFYTLFVLLHSICASTLYLSLYTLFVFLHSICLCTLYLSFYTLFVFLHSICLSTLYLCF